MCVRESGDLCKVFGGFSFAGPGRALGSATKVQVESAHEGAVASVCERGDNKATAVPQILIPIVPACIHHLH